MWRGPLLPCVVKNLDRVHPEHCELQARFFQKDGESAMNISDLYILVVLVWKASILSVPSWKRIYVHKFYFSGLQNVISGEVDLL